MTVLAGLTRRELAASVAIALAIFAGAALLWNQLAPWLLEAPDPIEVVARSDEIVRSPAGRLVQRYVFDVDIHETCGSQTFIRSLIDIQHNESSAPKVLRSPGDTSQYFQHWLPIGSHMGAVTEIEVEPGRRGSITLEGAFDHCSSGFRGNLLIYSFDFDWSPARLATIK
jgi:hypothetical protein